MQSFTASDARRRFGRPLEIVQREPVTTTENGRAMAMMLWALDEDLIAVVKGSLEEH